MINVEWWFSRQAHKTTHLTIFLILFHNIWLHVDKLSFINTDNSINGGARGVMVILVGNGHGDTSSNPGRDWLHFT